MDVLIFSAALGCVIMIGIFATILGVYGAGAVERKRYKAALNVGFGVRKRFGMMGTDATFKKPFFGRDFYGFFGAKCLHLIKQFPVLPFENYPIVKNISAWLGRYAPAVLQDHVSHLFSWHLVSIGILCIIALIFRHLEFGVILGCLSIVAPYMWLSHVHKKETQILRAQIVEFLESLSDSLKANKSLGQAFQSFNIVCKRPLKPVIEKTVALMACGLFPDQAFCEATKSIEIQEIQALGTALQIQYKMGGNLNNLLAEFSSHFREAILFEQNLQAQTAQGRLSVKVVGIVPPLLILVMNLIVPGYFSSFISVPLGRNLFVLALVLDVVGLLIVKRIMSLSVNL